MLFSNALKRSIFLKLRIQMYFAWVLIFPEVRRLSFILNFQKRRKSSLKRAVFRTVHAYGRVFRIFLLIRDLFALRILNSFIILLI